MRRLRFKAKSVLLYSTSFKTFFIRLIREAKILATNRGHQSNVVLQVKAIANAGMAKFVSPGAGIGLGRVEGVKKEGLSCLFLDYSVFCPNYDSISERPFSVERTLVDSHCPLA